MAAQAIPNDVIAVVADELGQHYYNHTRLNTLFAESGAPGDPPDGNCIKKSEQWLKRCNNDPKIDAFEVLGRVLEHYMGLEREPMPWDRTPKETGQQRIRKILARHGLTYTIGGVIMSASSAPATKSLQELLRSKDLPGVEKEFQRAIATVESDPPAGVTAACSLLEALFKTIIEDEGLQLPSDQSIVPLYKPVRDHFHLNPAEVAEQDLKRIMTGLISILDGIGALRTHTGSAHGRGRQSIELSSSHARLAINGAHTLAFFLLETWGASKTT
jgi:hypothetical protein